MMRKICFYNHWHNGDVFSSKAFVQEIMRAYPGFDYAYVTNTDPAVMADLRCVTLHVKDLPPGLSCYQQGAVQADWVFINTWVGSYIDTVFEPGQGHANYPSLVRMWNQIYTKLKELMQIDLPLHAEDWIAAPTTDWSVYNVAAADVWCQQHPGSKWLFCNGGVRSGQSVWGLMQDEIDHLAQLYPQSWFVCTQAFETDLPNIVFSDQIFQQQCDLNEIAYLSMSCDLIWGKNSGPYMFCHNPCNLLERLCTFVSASDRPTDSYPYKSGVLSCNYVHTTTRQSDVMIQQLKHCWEQRHNLWAKGTVQLLT